MKNFTQFIAIIAVLLTFTASASAADVAGLQVRFGQGTEAGIQTEIEKTISASAKKVSKWRYVSTGSTRAKLPPVVKDCFTADCLKKAGVATKAKAGLRIRFSGEAQIYDWTIDIFNLTNGKLIKSSKGACELCGKSEVTRTFGTSLVGLLKAAPVPGKKTSSGTSKNTGTVKSNTKKEPRDIAVSDPDPDPIEPRDSIATPNRVTIVKVEIDVQPTDAEVSMNGSVVGTGSTVLELSPGTYELKFRREGYQGFIEKLIVGDRAPAVKMRVHMSKTDPDPVILANTEGPIDRLGSKRTTYGIIGLAAGSVLILSGMYLTAIDGDSTCEDGVDFQRCQTVYDTGTYAFLATATGAVLITSGAALLLWQALAGKPDEKATGVESAVVTPTFSGTGLGVGFSAKF